MKHVPKFCMVADCKVEASYWIDSEGFVEALMSEPAPETFYLCSDHMTKVVNDETGNYHHLRIDTGEIFEMEIAGYACDPECEICND